MTVTKEQARRTSTIAIVIATILSVAIGGCRKSDPDKVSTPRPRIISYSPSVTDILFDLGLGDNLVGVTSWCILPPGVSKPIVGSESTVNTEAIMSLSPDLIFIQQDSSSFESLREQMPQVRVISVQHDSVAGIMDSIRTIGNAAGADDRATELIADIQARLAAVRDRCKGRRRPRVLFVMGYDHPGTCGAGTYLDEIIRIAGGVNAAAERYKDWPSINAEMVLALAPDVLICQTNPGEIDAARGYWMSLEHLPAAAQGRIYMTTDRRLTIYGSRVARTAEQFAQWIQGSPEAEATAPAEAADEVAR